MATQIKLRRDSYQNWYDNNPVLAEGEPGYDLTNKKLKIGDGVTTWRLLPYFDDQVTDLSAVAQNIIPDADNTRDLGSPDKQWRHVYMSGGSIYLDNIKLSNNAGKLEVTKVINPGEENEAPDPEDSNAGDSVTRKLTNGEHTFELMNDGSLELDGDPFNGGGGGFTLPPNTTFDDFYEDGGATIYNSGGKIQLYSLVSEGNDGVNIRVKGDGGDSTWEFKSDGILTLPNSTTIGNDLAGEYASSFLCLPWGVNDQTSGLFSSNGTAHPIFDPLIATVAVGWFVSGPGLTGVKEITQIVEMGDGDRAFIVDLTDGSLWADLSVQIPYRFYSPDYSLVYNGTRLTVDSNEWNFTQAGDLTIPGNINEKAGNDLEIAVHNNRNNDGTPGSAVLSLTNNDAVDFQTYTTLEVGAYDIKLNTDYEGVFTGARRTWEFKRDGILTFPGGATVRDLPGETTDDSLLLLGAGATIDENVRAARIGINGSVEGVVIGAGSNDWTFTNDGSLTLPQGGDIKDSEGNSVLGGGTISVGNGIGPSVEQVSEILFNGTVTEIGPNVVGVSIDPSIANTKRGFINLVGDRPNQDSTIGFSTVAVWGDYAYVLGSDFYFTSSTDKTKVYKFDLRTGEQVWVKQIRSSRGAEFNLTVGSGTVTIDLISDSGTGYKVGEEIVIRGDQIGGAFMTNDITIIVNTIDGSGGVNTASVKPGYDVTGLTGTYTNISIQNDDILGDTCAIAYSPLINKVLAVSEYWTNYGDNQDTNWTWANLYVIDPATGVIDSSVTLSDEGDIFPISMAVTSVSGDVAIAGEKYNEYRELGELTLLAGYNGYFDILKSNLDPEHYPGDPYSNYGDFWVTGTGITNQENVDNVNEYANVATTVREGGGATFDITVTTPGGEYVPVVVSTAGTNYRVGHKIKVLGTDLEGTTPANDLIITVTSVDGNGGITGISTSGTANAGATMMVYTQSGSNYQVGSGYTAFIYVDATTGAYNYGGSNNPGSNYVAGDVITIAGTTFANGATPANDATIIVGTVDGSGAVNSIQGGTVSGTGQTNALRIRVDGVDFTAPGGEWMMRQNLGGEAFVWTANWSNAIGGASGDRFYDVSWNSDATAIYAVGVGRYEVNYDQALVVKFNAVTGAVIWSKDIKFSEATTENRQARAVCMIPGSSDIMVAGAWYNNASGYDEIILTRITSAGAAVWQKTYLMGENESGFYFDNEISIKALDSTNVLISFEQGTNNSTGLAYLKVNATTGLVVLHRVLSSPGNGNYNFHDTATPTFADIYTEGSDDYVVMAGRTYVPTDDSRNALLIKLPVDGLKNLEISERLSLGEHLLTRHDVVVTTVTPAFDSFTPEEHLNTITNLENARNYSTIAPDGELGVWTYTVTDDTAGFLEFGDGSKQSFATNVIPQIPAANSYYITEQDSGKHLFFEHENGTVYIPHRDGRYFPVGFTFTIVNTSGSDVWVETMTGSSNRGRLKLAGRNIDTPYIGIPDSGSGSMVTFLKIKDGYTMDNSDGLGDYPDIWIVSGPSDVYNAD